VTSRPIDPRLPAPGAVIAGKYEILRVVGEGGMGVVFEGVHVKMRQRVAIKMLLPDTLSLPDVVARFEREARASGQLRSRHAARVMDVDQTPDGIPYMVMEFLEGDDLGTQIDTRGKIPVAESVDYLLQACVAIDEAHAAGIVHRDLKPSNLFLARGPEGAIVKLLDFGISKVTTEADRLTSAESVMGTPLYMSPEQVRSARNVDERTDIWSLGVILYELLSGTTPFSGTTTQVAAAVVTDDVPPILVDHGAPPALQEIVLRALQRDRTRRQSSARELASALLPFADPSSTGARAAQIMLAGGAVSGSALVPPPQSGPMSARATRPSGQSPVADATTGQDATVFNPPLDPPAPPGERQKTERTWTRGGEKKKASPFVLFGVVAIGVAVVIAGSVIAVAKIRGVRGLAAHPSASAAPAETGAAASPAASPATVALENVAPQGAASAAGVASPAPSEAVSIASTVPSSPPSARSPSQSRPPHGGGRPTSNTATAQPTPPATTKPTSTATTPPAATTAAPAIPNHL
jgi:serine/threonine-protein kinase